MLFYILQYNPALKSIAIIKRIMIYSVIKSLCNITYAADLNRFIGTYGKNKAVILMYHGITIPHSHSPLKNYYGYNVAENEFKDQVRYLAINCNVVSASEAISGENLSMKKKNVVITFDDGYRNNFTSAYSVLKEYDLPALYSISTDFVNNRNALWNDIIEYAVIHTRKSAARIKHEDSWQDFKLVTIQDKIQLYNWLLAMCTEIKQENRENFILDVLRELNVQLDNEKLFKDPDYAPMKPDDISIMADSGMAEFASHSVHHYALTRTDEDTLLNEAAESKKKIEKLSGKQCRYFCIPGGHCNKQVTEAVFKAGYEKIFTSEFSEFDLKKKSEIIGRYCITGSVNMALFADMVHGPFHRLYYSVESRR